MSLVTNGMAKAMVLPEPVLPRPNTSRPASVSGRVASWIGNGDTAPSLVSTGSSVAGTPSSAKLADGCPGMIDNPLRGNRKGGVVLVRGWLSAEVAVRPARGVLARRCGRAGADLPPGCRDAAAGRGAWPAAACDPRAALAAAPGPDWPRRYRCAADRRPAGGRGPCLLAGVRFSRSAERDDGRTVGAAGAAGTGGRLRMLEEKAPTEKTPVVTGRSSTGAECGRAEDCEEVLMK